MKFKVGKISKILAFAAVLQIILLVNTSVSENYFIHESSGIDDKNPVVGLKDIEKVFDKAINLLIGFLSIKQIGFVSAADACCEKTVDGNSCVRTDSGQCDRSGSLRVSPNQCKDTTFCDTGWCFDSVSGYCSGESPKASCESSGGQWTLEQGERCEPGCCEMGINTMPGVTERTCEYFGKSEGISYEFDPTLSDQECVFYTEDKGACIIDEQKNCKYVTQKYCFESLHGLDFKKGVFCSDPNIGNGYIKQHHKGCIKERDDISNKEDVFWFDNHNNPENVAIDCDEREEKCDDSSGTPVCKSLKCWDVKNRKTRINGESWCEYDSYIGEGKDLPGSLHWLRSCEEGEIKNKTDCSVGDYRTEVCAEKIVDGVSMAQCRKNLAPLCFTIDNQAECELPDGNPDCRWHSLYVDRGFKLDVCLPKYPEGFKDQTQAEQVCGWATQTCTMVEEKKNVFDDWDCKGSYEIDGKTVYGNCNCRKEVFVQQMNNLCTSLGDCGAKPNYAGKGTDNYQVTGTSYLNWESICQAYAVCGTECHRERAVRRGGGWDSEEIKDPISGTGTGEYMNCRGDNPLGKNPILRNIIKNNCNNYGQCVSGQYVIRKPRWKNSLGLLNKSNTIGNNTPQYILFPEDVGTYGDEFNPQSGIQEGGYDGRQFGLGTLWGVIEIAIGILELIFLGPIGIIDLLLGGLILWAFTIDYRTKDVTFTCQPWKPPIGGADCEKCNKDPSKPCTEYRCESLGTACGLETNVYNSENPLCFNKYANDNNTPVITPNTIRIGYKFIPGNNSVSIKTTNDECIRRDNLITFSLKTDEYAECKWSERPLPLFADMLERFKEGNAWWPIHSIEDLPMPNNNESNLRMYVRCIDHAGNWNRNEYVVNICISNVPDIRAPIVIRREPESGSYLKKGVTNSSLKIVLNEASQCKYSSTPNTKYENMTGYMGCNNIPDEDDGYVYEWNCRTTLTGLTLPENRVYIRCNDSVGNVNLADEVYILKQTLEDLKIVSVSPQNNYVRENPITEDNPLVLEVETGGGMNNGIASCEYKFLGVGWRDEFFETDNTRHRQVFTSIGEGNYNVEIKCKDLAGNEAKTLLHFTLDIDDQPPRVINMTSTTNNGVTDVELTTDEEAVCYYNFDMCKRDPENQTQIPQGNSNTEHLIENLNKRRDYFVTCQDSWGNKNPNCAIKINATEKDDGRSPEITRVYYDGGLKLITNEEASCAYSTTTCNFNIENGISMTQGNSTEHEADWNLGRTYHIKCMDSWGNPKTSNAGCLIIVKPGELI